MSDLLAANGMIIAAVVALLALTALWWLLSRARRRGAAERSYRPDVLDEGVGPARRNQALIDAPSATAAALSAGVPDVLGGMAETIAAGAAEVATTARAAPEPQPVAPSPAPPPPAPPPPAPEVEPAHPDPAPELPDERPVEPEPEPQVPAEPLPAQEPQPEPPPQQPVDVAADDLSRIKGLGPKLQALLPTLGLTSFAQIAALSEADLAALDGKLGAFAGRPARDKWVEQAKFLASGDVAGFEAMFGKV